MDSIRAFTMPEDKWLEDWVFGIDPVPLTRKEINSRRYWRFIKRNYQYWLYKEMHCKVLEYLGLIKPLPGRKP